MSPPLRVTSTCTAPSRCGGVVWPILVHRLCRLRRRFTHRSMDTIARHLPPTPAVLRRPGVRRALRVGRWVLVAAYVAFVLVWWKRNGVPLERLQILGWIAGGLLLATTGRRNGGPWPIVRDWLPIGVVLAAYDLSRGVADTLGMPVQMRSIVRIEQAISFGHVPTVVAQQHLGPYDGPVRWWEVPVAFAYLSHFVVPFAVMGVLWAVRREEFRQYRNALLALTALGLATYILVPAAPPWLASRNDLIGPVERVGLRGMEAFGLNTAGALVHYGARFGNAVAALPSLHAGWATLTAVWFARKLAWWWWPLLFAYPVIMGVSLVISGEHYVFDVLLGYLYAGVTVVLVARVERWWASRRAGRGGRADGLIDLRNQRPAPVPAPAGATTGSPGGTAQHAAVDHQVRAGDPRGQI